MRMLDGKGSVKSTESKTYEVMEIYGSQIHRLITIDDTCGPATPPRRKKTESGR